MSAKADLNYVLDGNGNAFAIMNRFQRSARKAGMPDYEIAAVLAEAKTSDYNHLLSTIMGACK